jgi:hypothetical protein
MRAQDKFRDRDGVQDKFKDPYVHFESTWTGMTTRDKFKDYR